MALVSEEGSTLKPITRGHDTHPTALRTLVHCQSVLGVATSVRMKHTTPFLLTLFSSSSHFFIFFSLQRSQPESARMFNVLGCQIKGSRVFFVVFPFTIPFLRFVASLLGLQLPLNIPLFLTV